VSSLLMAVLVLVVIGFAWFGIHYLLNRPIDAPDGEARVTGNCGDTMELAFKMKGERVRQSRFWTNGCSYSRLCVEAAAMLARDRTLPELRKINMASILDVVGDLPDTHLHCAQLADITLQRAVDRLEEGREAALPEQARS
jgi:nitrogen fixation protein NifU and related proteins